MTYTITEGLQGILKLAAQGPIQQVHISDSDLGLTQHVLGLGTTPVASLGAGPGVSPTLSSLVGHDVAGQAFITTGTTPTLGALVTVAFGRPFAALPYPQVNAGTASLSAAFIYVTASVNSFTVNTLIAPPASASLNLVWHVIG